IARCKNGAWYVGALTDWSARDLEIDLGAFLPNGSYQVEIFRDGINADRNAMDYVHEYHTVSVSAANHKMTVHMAPGGGWTARFSRL
ncbi:MAG: glycoside hydrolase family 97 C-terminal domain-containing protein, partial [Bacteroidales bacterium]|nr:glycoside hydrolase family 97 C-terminal domain-containing protein [Bacteroidales bacterium]